MRIAFYAPMKPADHPVPSGDREIARLLIQALGTAGHSVEIASRFSSRDGSGDPVRQARLRDLGCRTAERLIRRYRARPAYERPDAWITYHVYHKSPDWLGPAIADAFAIPYLIVEASSAPKRAGGPWDIGYSGANAAIRRADAVLTLNSDDAACLKPVMSDSAWHRHLPPFVDTSRFAALAEFRTTIRAGFAQRCHWNPDIPWLLAVGMMRGGDKQASYEVLAKAIFELADEPWHLLVVGDGPQRAGIVHQLTAAAPGRVAFLGELSNEDLALVYTASDMLVWPAINEAFGMALLEAQAAGRPVVAGNQRGVPDIVSPGVTGLLPPAGDAGAFAEAVRRLLQDDEMRHAFSTAAARHAREKFDLAGAAHEIGRAIDLACLHAGNRAIPGAA